MHLLGTLFILFLITLLMSLQMACSDTEKSSLGAACCDSDYTSCAAAMQKESERERESYLSPTENPSTISIPPDQQGYDVEFDPPLESKYECPICLMGLRSAVQTPCGHRFCQSCITKSIRSAAFAVHMFCCTGRDRYGFCDRGVHTIQMTVEIKLFTRFIR